MDDRNQPRELDPRELNPRELDPGEPLVTLHQFVLKGSVMCLHNVPELRADVGVCGDYIVDGEREQCDCGPAVTCEDPCCDALNCTLKPGALCSAMHLCCDPHTCDVREKGFTCRSEANECDVTEQCDGESARCANDAYKPIGSECTSIKGHQGHCYFGDCLSVEDQCEQWVIVALVALLKIQPSFFRVFLPDGLESVSSEACWEYNKEGTFGGNCGSPSQGVYEACSDANKKLLLTLFLNLNFFNLFYYFDVT